MACTSGSTTFKIQNGPESGDKEIPATEQNLVLCNATKILDRLHTEFTTANAEAGNPSYWLRRQPAPTTGTNVYRLYGMLFAEKDEMVQEYRTGIHAIMNGVNTTPSITDYVNNTMSNLASIQNDHAKFKGLYGLIQVNNLLEKEIQKKVDELRGDGATSTVQTDAKFYKERKNIKNTVEEIAYQENKLYREKFLNIILVFFGIFIVSIQLLQSSGFSGGGGDGGGGGGVLGFGGVGGWLSTRFGSGSGGIFSRFGGLGLGNSGRSRVGNLFTSNPYSLSKRE
jgi:hypothetical protein